MSVAIKASNISKRYRIGGPEQKYETLAAQLTGLIKAPFRNYRDLRKLNRFDQEDDPTTFWALKDINFEVQQGEVLGIIGHNGAGKSTLLKILSRITEASSGEIDIYGRISSLLEVGTGFHPDLSGRDNIFMNGTILGMSRREITSKLDEIVEFSGISKHLDTPVKRYSSGMTVRLAFAVAAHLEPEILIVDEVLAVGDSEFQRKCLGKMEQVSKSGRTILFVSHNLAAVEELCTRTLVLNKGRVVYDGEVEAGLQQYHMAFQSQLTNGELAWPSNEHINVINFSVSTGIADEPVITCDTPIHFELEFENLLAGRSQDCTFELRRFDGSVIFHQAFEFAPNRNSQKGIHYISGKIPPQLLNAGMYVWKIIFGENRQYSLLTIDNAGSFEVMNTPTLLGSIVNTPPGCLRIDLGMQFSIQ